MPFYSPTIGGSHSVRSLSDYRFRDDNIMFFNVEYRWEAFGGLDMALFTDWALSRRGRRISISVTSSAPRDRLPVQHGEGRILPDRHRHRRRRRHQIHDEIQQDVLTQDVLPDVRH